MRLAEKLDWKGLNIKDIVIKRDRSAFIVTPVASQNLYQNTLDRRWGEEIGIVGIVAHSVTDADKLEGTEDDI
jgi:hypothetical protein